MINEKMERPVLRCPINEFPSDRQGTGIRINLNWARTLSDSAKEFFLKQYPDIDIEAAENDKLIGLGITVEGDTPAEMVCPLLTPKCFLRRGERFVSTFRGTTYSGDHYFMFELTLLGALFQRVPIGVRSTNSKPSFDSCDIIHTHLLHVTDDDTTLFDYVIWFWAERSTM